MSQQTKIEWTESTWNPITGCSVVSDGCLNCYAATLAKRLKAMKNPRYVNGFDVTVHYDLIRKPLEWKKPQKIFVNSMSDLFHEDVNDEVIIDIFKTMNEAYWHQFQILTKRAERLASLSPRLTWTSNIWMGVSIENEKTLHRSDLLRQCGARVKFISAEPLLGSISALNLEDIDWLIVGGESGAGCRPMKESWAIELRDKAHETGTAFFFKQWGGFPRSKGGKLLQGLEYHEFPEF